MWHREGALPARTRRGTPAAAGGWRFPIDPALSAREARVWWRPELLTVVVRLQPAPDDGTGLVRFDPAAWPEPVEMVAFGGGLLIQIGPPLQPLRLWVRDPPQPGAPLEAVVPLDPVWSVRVRALQRAAVLLQPLPRSPPGSCGPPDPLPLTPQQRGRYVQALRAHDGSVAGASQREIAAALFG